VQSEGVATILTHCLVPALFILSIRYLPQLNTSEPPDMDTQPDMSSQPSSPDPHDIAAAALIELYKSVPQGAVNVTPGSPSNVERHLANSPSPMSESSMSSIRIVPNGDDEEMGDQTDVSHREATVDRDAGRVSPRQVLAAAEAAAAAQDPSRLPSHPSRSLWPTPTADKTVDKLGSASVGDAPDTATGYGLRGSSSTEKPLLSDAFPKPPSPKTGKHISLSLT
jgi:hypothetical protein